LLTWHPALITKVLMDQLGVIDTGPWKKAVFTTFTLNIAYFESHVLPHLHRAHCDDITILVDEKFYLASLADSKAKFIGTAYRVFPVAMKSGVFHGKLTYLFQEQLADTCMIGSGNLTLSGAGRQLECLDVLQAEPDRRCFLDLAEVFARLRNTPAASLGPAQDVINELEQRARRVGSAAENAEVRDRVLCSLHEPISRQVVNALDGRGKFNKIVVMSPFHSPDAGPSIRLARSLGVTTVHVAVDGKSLETPVADTAKGVKFVVRDSDDGDGRGTHAKWYEFRGNENWLLSGSVNATRASLETSDNFEVATLRILPKAQLAYWRACSPEATGVPQPPIAAGDGKIALTLETDRGTKIRGAFLEQSNFDGEWAAHLNIQGVVWPLPPIAVLDGQFTCHLPAALEENDVEPAQLVLTKGQQCAAGWVMFLSELQMTREEREFSRRLRRLNNYSANHEEFISVLSWLSQQIGSLERFAPRAPTSQIVERSKHEFAPSKEPFDYAKWASHSIFDLNRQGNTLGACRIAFHALAQFGSREMRGEGAFKAGATPMTNPISAFDDDEEGLIKGDRQEEFRENDLRVLESLRDGLARNIEKMEADSDARRFYLEALLWVLLIIDRQSRQGALDALPFSQWMRHVAPRNNPTFASEGTAILVLTAVSCAWAMRAPGEVRLEDFASLARYARQRISANDPESAVASALREWPSFSLISEAQRTLVETEIPTLLQHKGLGIKLHDYLTEWKVASWDGKRGAPSDLIDATGSALIELQARKAQLKPFIEWTTALPSECPAKCSQPFDSSDKSVLRNRRALKCIRCGQLHFWTGA
jgi:hypothetical protein